MYRYRRRIESILMRTSGNCSSLSFCIALKKIRCILCLSFLISTIPFPDMFFHPLNHSWCCSFFFCTLLCHVCHYDTFLFYMIPSIFSFSPFPCPLSSSLSSACISLLYLQFHYSYFYIFCQISPLCFFSFLCLSKIFPFFFFTIDLCFFFLLLLLAFIVFFLPYVRPYFFVTSIPFFILYALII